MGYLDTRYTKFVLGDSQMCQVGLYTGHVGPRGAVCTSYKARVRHFQNLCSQTRQNFEDGVTIFFDTQFVASYPTAQRMLGCESCSTELSFVV